MAFFRRSKRPREGPSIWQRALRKVVHQVDSATLEELEERLISADFGVRYSTHFVNLVEKAARSSSTPHDEAAIRQLLADAIAQVFTDDPDDGLAQAVSPPTVYMLVGVNGTGKTTTVGKIAHRLRKNGHSVLIAAADTYRAGAIEQAERWAKRTGAEFVGGQPGADPAAVAFDAVEAAQARGIDVVLVDTAGRLHTHPGLMDELAKVERVIARKQEGAPHETLLVLDATVGQNGLVQAREFSGCVSVSGIVLAKADSTAKGGIVVALREELKIPVRLVGVGESPDDLEAFDSQEFARALTSDPSR